MWQLFFFVIGFIFCYSDEADVKTTAGEDVDLVCFMTSTDDQIVLITWKQSHGNILFNCDPSKPCENNTTIHTLEQNDTFISSTLEIRNVSLVHEDEYDVTMKSQDDVKTCKINLTVNVPPKGLILIEKANDNILQNQESLTVAEGENRTLVCKTNLPVTQFVHLEWVFPSNLNASDEPQQNTYDGHDKHLLVPTRTIHFTPKYADGIDIVLICKVVSNSTHNRIQTSVIIKNEGECTTRRESLKTGPKESHRVITNFTGSVTSHTTNFGPTNQESTEKPWYIQTRLVLPGFSGLVMLLIVLAFVGGFIRSKKKKVRRSIDAESSEFRQPQGRRALPPTPSDQSSLPTNHLPDQPPPTARLLRPVPSIPPDIPMRPLVPVSEDATRRPTERTVTQAQKELDTEMEYDLLNISHHGATGTVPHVYKETTNGLAEYAIVSRQKVDKRVDHRQLHRSKQMDDDSEYDLLNTWNQTGHVTVPHVYKETTSGLAEYAVVSKPDDKKKCQSLGPLTKVMKAPINVEAEYALVDKSKKRAKESKPSHL